MSIKRYSNNSPQKYPLDMLQDLSLNIEKELNKLLSVKTPPENHSLIQENQRLRQQVQQTREKVKTLQDKLSSAVARVQIKQDSKLQLQNAHLKQTIVQLQTQLSSLRKQIKSVSERTALEVQQLAQQNSTLMNDLSQFRLLKIQFSSKEKELNYTNNKINQLQALLSDKQNTLVQIEQKLSSQKKTLRTSLKQLQQKLADTQLAIHKANLDLQTQKKKHQISKNQLNSLIKQISQQKLSTVVHQLQPTIYAPAPQTFENNIKLQQSLKKLSAKEEQLMRQKLQKQKLLKDLMQQKKNSNQLKVKLSSGQKNERQQISKTSEVSELSRRVKELEQEKQGYKAQIFQLQKKCKKAKKPQEGAAVDSKTNNKVKILNEQVQNLIRNLDSQRAKCNNLAKQIKKFQKFFQGNQGKKDIIENWLYLFFKNYMQLLSQTDISKSIQLNTLQQHINRKYQKSQIQQDSDVITSAHTELKEKIRSYRKQSQNFKKKKSILDERLKNENSLMKLLIKQKGFQNTFQKFKEIIKKLQDQNKFLNKEQFQKKAFQDHQNQLKNIQVNTNFHTAQSLVKTIFIFLQEIIKNFEGNFYCGNMLSQIQQIMRGGIEKAESQIKITDLLQKIKQWMVAKIKNFRKKITRIIERRPQQGLHTIQQQQQPQNIPQPTSSPQVQEKLKFAERKLRKVMAEQEMIAQKQQNLKLLLQEFQAKSIQTKHSKYIKIMQQVLQEIISGKVPEIQLKKYAQQISTQHFQSLAKTRQKVNRLAERQRLKEQLLKKMQKSSLDALKDEIKSILTT